MAFTYKPRSATAWKARQDQTAYDNQDFIKSQFTRYKTKPGDNWVRILPPTWADPVHYGLDVFVHFGIGPDRASVLCPFKHGRGPCPVCEAVQQAERDGDKDLASEYRVSKRVLAWIVDRHDEAKGAQLFNMSWTLDRDISKVSTDPRTGEVYQIDDPENGYDISFDRTGEKMTTKYVGIQTSKRPVAIDTSFVDFVVANPVPTTLLWRDYAEIKKLLSGDAVPVSTAETHGGRAVGPDAGSERHVEKSAADKRREMFNDTPDEKTAAPVTQRAREPIQETAQREEPKSTTRAAESSEPVSGIARLRQRLAAKGE